MDVTKILAGELDAKWYKIPGAGNARVRIRNISPKQRDRLQAQCTKKKRIKGELIDDTNLDKLSGLLAAECIVEWESIEADGVPLPCNPENRVRLERMWPEFSAVFNGALREEIEAALQVEEDESGNSEGGPISS